MTEEQLVARIHPEDRVAVAVAWANALNGAPYDVEYRLVADGDEKWVRARAEIEFAAEGTAVAVVGTVQDNTERKHTEAALRRAEKLAALGTMAGGVAHGFNNILLAIMGRWRSSAPIRRTST